jgi:hypothetical protein
MKCETMDENLVGYLLKSLDPDEQLAVEANLETHPESRAKLELLERALAPLSADAEESDVPSGLALSTLARIAEHKCRPLPPAPRPPRSQLAPSGWPRVRRVDVLAAAALLIIVGGLAFPVFARMRLERERTECANNLRTVWGALAEYSDRNADRAFPMVEAEGPRSVAGVFVPILQDAGSFGDNVPVYCPGRSVQPRPTGISVHDLELAFNRSGEEFDGLAREMAGGYAYTLGYRNGPNLIGLTANDPGTLPIVADDLSAGGDNSRNHGGYGQNVLYIGGNVSWCVKRTVGEAGDDIYVNKQNYLRAGADRSDTVLGPGDARPTSPPE